MCPNPSVTIEDAHSDSLLKEFGNFPGMPTQHLLVLARCRSNGLAVKKEFDTHFVRLVSASNQERDKFLFDNKLG